MHVVEGRKFRAAMQQMAFEIGKSMQMVLAQRVQYNHLPASIPDLTNSLRYFAVRGFMTLELGVSVK